jgi:vacuolar-type H+-ATPase subunit E/Vma4
METVREISPEPDETTRPRAATEVGQRIAGILDAAEASAEKIRSSARAEAAQILHQAHERAAARMEELTLEPERIRDEAARQADAVRAAADAYAAETRDAADAYSSKVGASADTYSDETHASADDYAEETRRAADETARQLRQDAEADVRKIEEDGRRLQKELADQTRQLVAVRDQAAVRVRAAIGGLRGAADELETETLAAAGIDVGEPEAAARVLTRLFRREAPVNAPSASAVHAAPSPSPSDDLYDRAKELGIRGRSKMNRAELEAAVHAASAADGDDS